MQEELTDATDELSDVQQVQHVEMINGQSCDINGDLMDSQELLPSDQVIIQETVTVDQSTGGEQIVYQDADGTVHTAVLEVTPPGGNGQEQYAILVLPDGDMGGAEPEAALSMLQLQSSVPQ